MDWFGEDPHVIHDNRGYKCKGCRDYRHEIGGNLFYLITVGERGGGGVNCMYNDDGCTLFLLAWNTFHIIELLPGSYLEQH